MVVLDPYFFSKHCSEVETEMAALSQLAGKLNPKLHPPVTMCGGGAKEASDTNSHVDLDQLFNFLGAETDTLPSACESVRSDSVRSESTGTATNQHF